MRNSPRCNKIGTGKTILLCLTFLLLFSLALNFVLFKKAIYYYIAINALRLDPFELERYPAVSPAVHPTQADVVKTVVIFGDSRAFEWPPPQFSEGFNFINRGIGGQTSAQVLGRFERHVRSLKPDFILLQVGINDLKTIALFPYKKNQIISKCKQNIEDIVSKSLSLNATVIISTIFPAGKISPVRSLIWSDDVDMAVIELNRFIRTMRSEKVHILDTEPVLTDKSGKLRDGLTSDFLHLNKRGYAELNRVLVDTIMMIEGEEQAQSLH